MQKHTFFKPKVCLIVTIFIIILLLFFLQHTFQFLHNCLYTKVSLFEINEQTLSLIRFLARSRLTFFRTVTLENYKLHPDAFEVLWEKSCPASAAHANSGEQRKDLIKDLQKSNTTASVCGSLKPNLYRFLIAHCKYKRTHVNAHMPSHTSYSCYTELVLEVGLGIEFDTF